MQAVSEHTSLNKGNQVGWFRRTWNSWFPPKHTRLAELPDAEELLESGAHPPQVVEEDQESKWWYIWYGLRFVLPGGTGWKAGWAGLMAALIAGGPAFLAKFWGGTLTTLTERIIIGLAMAIPVPTFMFTFEYNRRFRQALENLRDDSVKLDLMQRLAIEDEANVEKNINALMMYSTYERVMLMQGNNNNAFNIEHYAELIIPEQDRLQERNELIEILARGRELKNNFRSPHPMLNEFRNIMAVMSYQCDVIYARYFDKTRSKVAYVLVSFIEIVGGIVSTFGLPIFAMILNENALPFDGIFFTNPSLAPYNGVAIGVGVIAAIGSGIFNTQDRLNAYGDCKALAGNGDNKEKVNATRLLIKNCKDAHARDDKWVRFFNKNHAPNEVMTVEPKNTLTLLRYRGERQLKTVEQGDVYTGPPGSSVLASSGRQSYQHAQVENDENSSRYNNY